MSSPSVLELSRWQFAVAALLITVKIFSSFIH
jgi:hypothetical protein